MSKPFFQVVGGGIDITSGLNTRGLEITIQDNAGFENDRLDLVVEDDPPLFTLPLQMAVGVTLGYDNQQGSDFRLNGVRSFCGLYLIDQFEFSAPPRILKMTGHSNFMNNDFKSSKDRDHHDTTLGEIVEKVAGETGLEPRVDEELAKLKIAHVDQANISNMQFLTQLAKKYGATVKVAEGKLYFGRKGALRTLGGFPMIPVLVPEIECINWSSKLSLRGDYEGVRARHDNLDKAEEEVEAEGKKEGRVKTLPHRYSTKEEAKVAAKNHKEDLDKEVETLSFTCVGNPNIMSECPILLDGFRPGIRTAWIADTVTHRISGSGYTTDVECKLPDAKTKDEEVEGRG